MTGVELVLVFVGLGAMALGTWAALPWLNRYVMPWLAEIDQQRMDDDLP